MTQKGAVSNFAPVFPMRLKMTIELFRADATAMQLPDGEKATPSGLLRPVVMIVAGSLFTTSLPNTGEM